MLLPLPQGKFRAGPLPSPSSLRCPKAQGGRLHLRSRDGKSLPTSTSGTSLGRWTLPIRQQKNAALTQGTNCCQPCMARSDFMPAEIVPAQVRVMVLPIDALAGHLSWTPIQLMGSHRPVWCHDRSEARPLDSIHGETPPPSLPQPCSALHCTSVFVLDLGDHTRGIVLAVVRTPPSCQSACVSSPFTGPGHLGLSSQRLQILQASVLHLLRSTQLQPGDAFGFFLKLSFSPRKA